MFMETIINTRRWWVQGSWMVIWKLKVSPRIKLVIWRVCIEVVPTSMRLKDKGNDCPSVCCVCEAGLENSSHLFSSSVV